MSNENKKRIIGVDLGGTKMLTVLFDSHFKVIASEKSKTDSSAGKKRFIKILNESIQNVIEDGRCIPKHILGIGIAVPGVVNHQTKAIVSCPNLPFLKNFPLTALLKKHWKAKVIIENDVNAGLFGEFQFGAAKGFSQVVGIFPGTGIGGALILDGKLYRGATGAAGEIGHIMIDPFGPSCGCGKNGCLEALAGRVAIASEASVLALKQKAPHLFELAGTDVSKVKSRILKKAIQSGDKSVEKLVRSKARLLGQSMATVVNLLNPELIVLGGGLVEAMPEIFVKESRTAMHEFAMTSLASKVKVVAAQLGDYAVAKGAAKLVFDAKKK